MTEQSTLSKYQKLTDKEHILKKPDTYIGSIENTDHEDYIFNEDKIVSKEFQYIPGLYKLFDEGIVNCRDHVIRQAQAVKDNIENALPVTNIEITIDEDGTIHMYNDGNGIDVAEHPEYKIWIPEMIFGHLRTSTNYDEKKKSYNMNEIPESEFSKKIVHPEFFELNPLPTAINLLPFLFIEEANEYFQQLNILF